MKHPGPHTLDELEPLLGKIRSFPGLTERKRGAFYRKSNGFLHFHEDPAGIFADLKESTGEFQRMRTTTASEQAALLKKMRELLRS